MLSVSGSTIDRRMRSYGHSKLDFSKMTDQQLDINVDKIVKDFPFCGENMIKSYYLAKVSKFRDRACVSHVTELIIRGLHRKKNMLQRRVYNVKGPNHFWHVDTNHKLVRWNFVIVGGIDGFRRLPMMPVCTNNNKADTLLHCFVAAVNEYGLPSWVRTDKGLENVQIADYMIEKRGLGEMFFRAFLVSFTTYFISLKMKTSLIHFISIILYILMVMLYSGKYDIMIL